VGKMSNNNEFGLKEIYDLTLKATYPIEMAGRKFEPGEVIARFDKIQLANFKEITNRISANGGFDNRARVWWEETKEIRITLAQGVFSTAQMTLMTNAKLLVNEGESIVKIHRRESLETNENGEGVTKFSLQEPVFVYDEETGDKITDFTW
jgi:hypothetical protein